MRQLETAQVAEIADSSAAAIWRSPDGRGLRRGHGEAVDEDVQARALHVAKSGKADPAEAGYEQFRTLCMGIKLAAGPANPRLRNTSIDDLWQEVREQRLPRAEWRRFAYAALVKKTEPTSSIPAGAAQLVAGAASLVASVATPAKGLLSSWARMPP